MLNKIREKHSKKILWVLSVIIIISFTLWGGSSFVGKRGVRILGKIEGKEITASDFDYYYNMAQIRFLLFPPTDKKEKITNKEISAHAWQYILLLSKVKKDNILVDDQDVVSAIRNMFSSKEEGFNKEVYTQFLTRRRIAPRIFEEYIRQFIQIEKLFDKYAKIEITDDEVKNSYITDTQEAKIEYIFIPYEKFNDEVVITAQDLESFYEENKDSFKEGEKIKIKYVSIDKDSDIFNQVSEIEALTDIKNIDELTSKFSLEIKETTFFGINDPIEGLGWNPVVNSAAFSLEKGILSSLIQTDNAGILFEKTQEKASFIPALESIKEKVVNQLKEKESKVKAEALCKEVLEEIKNENITNLKKIAKERKLEFKETDFFKYYDYIEGLGMDEALSKTIFSLGQEQIHLEPIMLLKGAYIVKLIEKSIFDEKDYQEKKKPAYDDLFQQKGFMARIRFLSAIEKESQLQIYAD
ncbi:MAG: SurA N-terminal domain-containing protein [Candidatus Omnitrophica bacterium]|nr:SurA N-terminal domain-containing protein [Candidatus Omnitrophota bacterium]